jgi:hypothetical protein
MPESRRRGRPRKGKAVERHPPRDITLQELRDGLAEAGEEFPIDDEEFRLWLKKRAEKELWFFSRWILGNDLLGKGRFHRDEVCPFLTNYSTSRSKLLMLPMTHLKTTVASRSIPLHLIVQPAASNIYFPGMKGVNSRTLLASENELKSKENLSYVRAHLESNELLWWCWPEVVWENPKDAKRWSDAQLEVPRNAIWAEATVGAVGIKSGFIGKYFDLIIADDIAAQEASLSPPTMERARKWRRAARTRFYDKSKGTGIFIGIGTHWPSDNDIYVEWKSEPTVEVMIRSIIEMDEVTKRERPLWPEQNSMENIEKLRLSTDPQEWTCWYMNKPSNRGYTALNWDDLRSYEVVQIEGVHDVLLFQDSRMDERIAIRQQTIARNLGFVVGGMAYSRENGRVRSKPPQGMSQDFYDYMHDKYPEMVPKQEGEE